MILSAGLVCSVLSEGKDVSLADSLLAVTVTADTGVVVSRTDTLSVKNSFTLSEILHQSPGLYVGDYGGLAGLKTVSLRAMGSPHTSIYIDGVRVGNVQSGQNELGMLGVENFGSAVIDYAQNSLSFNTARPQFGKSPVAGKLKFTAGSFGTYLPSARFDFRLSERLSLSANAAGTMSKGNFTYGDGQTRTNNDLKQLRAGLDLFGIMNRGDYHFKAFFNDSERGTPGSVSWPSDDRQGDRNAFIQGRMRNKFSDLYSLHVSAKASYDDISYLSTWGDSRYEQTEFQLNSAHIFHLNKIFNLSLAADLQWDGLNSTIYNAARLSAFTAATASLRLDSFSADASLEYSGAFDKGEMSRNAVSPSLDLKFTAAEGLVVSAFGRRAYRIPAFNELYYVGYGNPELLPEDAWLTDLGVDYNKKLSSSWRVNGRVDAFLNFLKNKITSAPTPEDPNIWQPYNIGKVRSAGVDVVAGADYASNGFDISFDASYSYISAIDRTPDSYSFDSQIPYIAKHTVIINASFGWNGFELNPLWNLRAGRSDSAGAIAPWNTFDLTLCKGFKFAGSMNLAAKLAARNLFDNRYELVSGYPMPGRSFIGGVEFMF